MHPTTTFDLVRRDHDERLAAARAERDRRTLRRDTAPGESGRPPEPRRGWFLLTVPALAGAAR